jgi:IS30 family transposase
MIALPEALRRTMILDNRKVFAQLERLGSCVTEAVYFECPSRSWERGTVENTNLLIRQFVPKRTNFEDFSRQRIKESEN